VNKTDILTLYDYNYWANRQVLEASEKVSFEQFVAPAQVSHGSLRGSLVHVFGAEVVWRLRCEQGLSPSALPAESEFTSLELLRRRWREEEKAMRAYLGSLNEADLDRPVEYTTTKGAPYETILWKLLVHVVNHGTQFRGETAVVLTNYGQSPGNLDMLFFFRKG
jgi:uncharacterized damage-inducible protein DinB